MRSGRCGHLFSVLLSIILLGGAHTSTFAAAPEIQSGPTVSAATAAVGDSLVFSINASDLDGDILSFAWDFGDSATGSGMGPSHTYTAAGTFVVTATVSDGTGNSVQGSVTVTVTGSSSEPGFKVSNKSVPLVLVHGNNSESAEQNRWGTFLIVMESYLNGQGIDLFNFTHDTSKAIGFNGQVGSAKDLADYINGTVLPSYPAGTKVILVAHSRGGLVSRSYMNFNNQGDQVLGLMTLGTPHLGAPLATVDWLAKLFERMGLSPLVFNQLVNSEAPWAERLLQFETGREGSLQLAWDNSDGAVSAPITIDIDADIYPSGKGQLTIADMNGTDQAADLSVFYTDELKARAGTLRALNTNDVYLNKVVAVGAYDDLLLIPGADVPDPSAEGVSNFITSKGLEGLTFLQANAHTGVVSNDVNFIANDGAVPLQSALLLDVSGGVSFASRDENLGVIVTLDNDLIAARKRVKKQIIFAKHKDGVGDHLELLVANPKKNARYWSVLKEEILSFVNGGSGSTADTDGDGFPNELEAALGFDISSALSSPLSGVTLGLPKVITVTKSKIKLNFLKSNKDAINVSGTLQLPVGFEPEGSEVLVFIGGIVRVFILDGKGKSPKGDESFRVSSKNAKFSIKFKKKVYAGSLIDEGLTGSENQSSVSVQVPLLIILANEVHQTVLSMTYSAKAGKVGSAK